MNTSVATIDGIKHTSVAHAYAVNLRTVAAILIVVACGLVISTYKYFGHTWDEPEHLAAGLQLIDRHIYTYDLQHPPLARVAMAIGPYLAGAHSYGEPGPSGEQEGRDILYRTGEYDLLLTLARLGMLPFFIVLLLATWAWARHLFGSAEATLAVFFVVAMPPLLGHAAVAALDVPGTALCTLAFYCLLRWFENRAWRFALGTGIAAGLAIGTKLSSLPFIALVALAWLIAWLWQAPRERARQTLLAAPWWGQVASVLALALLTTMFCYGFSFAYLVSAAQPSSPGLDYFFGSSGIAHQVAYFVARHVPLPVGLEGLASSIQALIDHNNQGHLSYLLGRHSDTGFRYFYLVAIAVKTPLPLLLLGLGGLVYLCRSARERGWAVAAATIAFVVILVFSSLYSHINIGMRHVLVLYPLLAIAAAAWFVSLWKRYNVYAARSALAALLLLQALPLWSAYPDYLPYFNILAGRQPEKILIDSDLDWGQDLERLRSRLRELRITHFGFVYRGSADVAGEHLPGVWLVEPFKPASGWIAASIFARDVSYKGEAFAWLKHYRPRERIGKSIDLYFIPDKPPRPH